MIDPRARAHQLIDAWDVYRNDQPEIQATVIYREREKKEGPETLVLFCKLPMDEHFCMEAWAEVITRLWDQGLVLELPIREMEVLVRP